MKMNEYLGNIVMFLKKEEKEMCNLCSMYEDCILQQIILVIQDIKVIDIVLRRELNVMEIVIVVFINVGESYFINQVQLIENKIQINFDLGKKENNGLLSGNVIG